MAITVTANPTTLTWGDFTVSASRPVDPNDGSQVDALTKFVYNLPALPPRIVAGHLALADPNIITITPDAKIFKFAPQTSTLLSHEQFHYDLGVVIARAFARELMALRGPNIVAIRTAFQSAVQLHFRTRTRLLQRRYDLDTRHGTNPHYQKIWKDRMTYCLAHPHSDHLGGFWL